MFRADSDDGARRAHNGGSDHWASGDVWSDKRDGFYHAHTVGERRALVQSPLESILNSLSPQSNLVVYNFGLITKNRTTNEDLKGVFADAPNPHNKGKDSADV